MSILSRYTIKEIFSHLVGVMAIVVAIFMVNHFAEFLGGAEGELPSNVLLWLLGLRTVMALPSLLPAGLYIATLLALGRLSDDNELTALAACGVSPARLHATVIGVAVFASVVAACLSFWARPWAAVAFHALRDQAVEEAGVDQIRPGRFYQLNSRGEQAFFAEARSTADPEFVDRVFVQQRDADGLSILSAARATETVDTASRYRTLRLFDGYRYDFGTDSQHCEITKYEDLTINTPLGDALPEQNHGLSLLELARSSDPEDAAELQWRIASPLSAFLLMLLAIPLSRIGPQYGHYAKLFVAIGLYLGYDQLLAVVKKWVANGVWPTFPGTWAVHALCLVMALGLLAAPRLADLRLRWWSALPAAATHPHSADFER